MLPILTCISVRDAITLAGAKPVFIYLDPISLNIILAYALEKLTDKTAVIVSIHYYGGFCTNIEEILDFAKQNNFILIEDCAHSLGAEFKSKKLGHFGNMCVFSLTKNMLNFVGGMLCTNDRLFYE